MSVALLCQANLKTQQGSRDWKGQFLSNLLKAMQKNCLLHTHIHRLVVMPCLQSGFQQCMKLHLPDVERSRFCEQRNRELPTSADHLKQESANIGFAYASFDGITEPRKILPPLTLPRNSQSVSGEQQLELRDQQPQNRKGVYQGYSIPVYLIICRNAGLDELKLNQDC